MEQSSVGAQWSRPQWELSGSAVEQSSMGVQWEQSSVGAQWELSGAELSGSSVEAELSGSRAQWELSGSSMGAELNGSRAQWEQSSVGAQWELSLACVRFINMIVANDSAKADGCVNLLFIIVSKCRRGGGGHKQVNDCRSIIFGSTGP